MGLNGNIREQAAGDTHIHLESYNRMVHAARRSYRIVFDPKYFRVDSMGDALRVSFNGVSENFPWDKLVFGYSIDQANDRVSIKNCVVQWSDQGLITRADYNVDIPTGGGEYYVGTTFTGGIGTPIASTDPDDFASDAATFRTWLYSFTRSDTGAAITRNLIGNIGIIQLDASYG